MSPSGRHQVDLLGEITMFLPSESGSSETLLDAGADHDVSEVRAELRATLRPYKKSSWAGPDERGARVSPDWPAAYHPGGTASQTGTAVEHPTTESEASLPGSQGAGQISAEPASEALSHGSSNLSARCGEGLLAHHLHWPPIGTVFPVRGNLPRPNDGSKCTGVTANASDGEQHIKPSVYVHLQPDPMVVSDEVREIVEFPGEIDPLTPIPHRRLRGIGVYKYSRRYAARFEHQTPLILDLYHQVLCIVPEIDGQPLKLAAGDLFSGSKSIPDRSEDGLNLVLLLGHLRRDAECLHETDSLQGVEERHQWQQLTLVSCLKRV